MGDTKKRILVIGSSSSPHVVSRISGLLKRGYDLTILTESKAGLEDIHEVSLYPTFHKVDSSAILAKILYKMNRFKEFWKIYKELRSIKPDIIHFHFALNRLGILFAFLLRKPIIVSVMGSDILFNEQGTTSRMDIFLVKSLLKRAKEITTKSEYLKDEVLKYGNYNDKTRKIIWGVDPHYFKPVEEKKLRDQLHLSKNAQILFCPKAMQPLYNLDLIITAVSIVRKNYPNLVLLLTDFNSDQEYKHLLLEKIEKLALQEHVKIIDQIDHREIVRYYNLSDIIIGIPSSDGLPQTLLESMACGKPHILGNLERYKEIVEDGKSAIFTDFEPSAIANSIENLLSDHNLRKEIGENARKIVLTEANIEQSFDLIESVYEKYLPANKQ